MIEPLIVFARAHEESAMKSHRRKDGWKQAREKARQGGGPMLKTCPAWLEVTAKGFRIKPDAAAVVQRIYALARDGLGVHRIAGQLTKDGVPPLGNGDRWVKAYVYRILTNPAAMGTYQPHRQDGKKVVADGPPITGHYPAVVSEAEWQATQKAITSRDGGFVTGGRGSPAAGRKGKDGQEANLFTGLLHCARTGERMHVVHALGRKVDGGRKRYRYLAASQETGAPGGARMDYPTFETAILELLAEVKPEDIGDAQPIKGRQAKITKLTDRLADIDGRRLRIRQRAKTGGDFDAYLDLLEELEAERKTVVDQLAGLQAEDESEQPAHLKEMQSLADVLRTTKPGQIAEVRRRLKGRLRALVSSASVLVVPRASTRLCAVQFFFRAGGVRSYLILYKPNRGDPEWSARSLPEGRGFDLRQSDHVKRLERVLASLLIDEPVR